MANNLETLLSKIEENERIAAIQLETIPWQTRPGVEGAKNMAGDNLIDLKKSYKEEVKKVSLCVFLEGDAQDKFASIADGELDCFSIDASRLYDRIAEKAYVLVDGRGMFSITNLVDLVDIIKDVTDGCGIKSMPMLDFPGEPFVQNVEALRDIIRDSIRKVVGDELNLHYIEHYLSEEALKTGYNADVCCLLVKRATKEEQVGLSKLCAGTAVLTVPNNPTEVNTTKAIQKIVQKFKGEPEIKESN